ncbi:MAG: hypothetical protein IIZ39_01470, partial [Blautia sp.]|nr:hypothetical protein [Blautia sp.]
MRHHTGAKPRILVRVIWVFLLLILALILFAGFSARRCLPMIWQNLTAARLPNPATQTWEGGKLYSH